MADAKSNYLENLVLDWVLGGATPTRPAARYLALFTAAPGETGGGTEVTGGSYARKTVTFAAAANGSASNSAVVEYPSMPAVTVTHFGIFDAATGGNLLYHGAFTASRTVNAGDTLTVPVASLTVSET